MTGFTFGGDQLKDGELRPLAGPESLAVKVAESGCLHFLKGRKSQSNALKTKTIEQALTGVRLGPFH